MLCCAHMPANSVLELLATQSAVKLQAMEQAIDEQIADLKAQKELVGRALTAKGVRPTPAPHADEKPPKRRKHRNGRTGSSSVIREVVQEQPGRVWMPIEIIRAAHERGVTSNAQSIRVALRRMGDQGFLKRGPNDEGWQYAAASNGHAEVNQTSPQRPQPEGEKTMS
jgi:hypothetical protein